MRRWNGWGDDRADPPLPPAALELLEELVGPGTPSPDASLESVVASVPTSRLSPDPMLDLDPEIRVRHARGQSLPDWIALRSGRIAAFPDAVARPSDAAEVRGVLDLARQTGARLIPFGGGTSVVGGVDVVPSERPVISVALGRITGLRAIDGTSGLATFGAGTLGPEVEAALEPHGLTLGHSPQSFEWSSVGGWVAARSSGQLSAGFGRIEALFAGGHLEAPVGPLDLPAHPASAAGPDLRQIVLGSEGRAGILTDVVVRTTGKPGVERFNAYVVSGWEEAIGLARDVAWSRLPLSMVRASTPLETASSFALAADATAVRWLKRYLAVRGKGQDRCVVIVGLMGPRRMVDAGAAELADLVRLWRGVAAPRVGQAWHGERFAAPYLRNTLWNAGYAVDTVETAVDWPRVGPLSQAIGPALRHGLDHLGERVHAFTHLSHVYPSGSSLYTTYAFRQAADPDETLERWRRLKRAASEVIVAHGGTISHQHGVGRDHAPYLAAEKGLVGMATLAATLRSLDPDGLMAPGVLLEDGP